MSLTTSYTNLFNQFLTNLGANIKLAEIDQNTLQKTASGFDLFLNNIYRENVSETLAWWTYMLDTLSVPLDDSDRDLTYSQLRDIYITGTTTPYLIPILGIVTVTDAATVTLDAANGNVFKWTIAASRTLLGVNNLVSGQSFVIEITQGTGGSFTVTFPATWKIPGGQSAITFTTAAGSLDILTGYYNGTTVTFTFSNDVKI